MSESSFITTSTTTTHLAKNLVKLTDDQCIPHAVVEQDEDDRIRLIRRVVHQVKNHPTVDSTPINIVHPAQYSLFTRTHRTRLAQELHDISVGLKRACHLVRTCLTFCCSCTCRAPRAHHLPHFGTTRSTPRTPSASSTFPRHPSRQAAPSITTLA